MSKRVLIVDDDPAQRRILEEVIKRLGYPTKTAASGDKALDILLGPDAGGISLVLLDLVMPGTDGIEVLNKLNGKPGIPPVIVETANGSIDAAITAMRAGAVDFVVKPASPERLECSIKNALKIEQLSGEITRIKKKVQGKLTFADLIISTDTMERVVSLGKRAAASNIPVLIEGESGVGKELIARSIQGESERAGGPFVVVNCGAIPENLIESTLFGHEKGSFTGAHEKRIGKFQEADGGTLFLDEVGDLSLEAQAKLLRFLEAGEFYRIGGTKKLHLKTRVVSATNKEIEKMTDENLFRKDLFFRLGVIKVQIPSLNERREDIIPLAKHFMYEFSKKFKKKFTGISQQTIDSLVAYNWTGNVRELKNLIERGVLTGRGPELGLQAIGLEELTKGKDLEPALHRTPFAPIPPEGIDLSSVEKAMEKFYIDEAFKMAKGNESKAAKLLNINHHTYRYRRRKLQTG